MNFALRASRLLEQSASLSHIMEQGRADIAMGQRHADIGAGRWLAA
jgi:hypothetical protein